MTDTNRTADQALDNVIAAMAGATAVAHDDQRSAVRALVKAEHVLVVQATGWGKSAVYWAATAALRSLGSGPTLIISPLLALMRDQIDSAQRAGVNAVTVNSSNRDDWDNVNEQLAANTVDALLISPERLAAPSFTRQLEQLANTVALVVIDEAHCISDWGFDFRPDYQRIARTLCKPGVAVLATTATANQRVTDDVAEQLGQHTLTLRGSLARASLRLGVAERANTVGAYAHAADLLEELAGTGHAGIIYCSTINDVNQLTSYLQHVGRNVAAYSGQTDPDQRAHIETQLRDNNLDAVIATSALGMGYDKGDIGFVIHVGSPGSPVAYYQQVGRAGRAIDDAVAICIPTTSDQALWDYFATAGIITEQHADAIVHELERTEPRSVADIEAATGIRRSRIDATLRTLAVDGAVERRNDGWYTGETTWTYPHDRYSTLREARRAEADTMRDYTNAQRCLMATLQHVLDDPDVVDCGRCSVCTSRPVIGNDVARPETVAAVTAFLGTTDHPLPARKRWPSGLRGPKGVIVGAENGRALDGIGANIWSDTIDTWIAGGDISNISDATFATFRRWKTDWTQRPTHICHIPSSRPATNDALRALTEHIGHHGKLTVIDPYQVDETHGKAPTMVASAQRVQHLLDHLRWVGDDINGGIIVIDDEWRTGWTLTVAAHLARQHGASHVWPYTLRQRP